jgi:hypothetical protein
VTIEDAVDLGVEEAGLVLAIMKDGAVLATCTSWTESGDDFEGTIDLNTTELVDEFSGARPLASRRFDIVLWHTADKILLVNDQITILNNPYSDASATPVNDARYALKNPGDGSYRISSDGTHLQLYDPATGLYRTLFVTGGALALGPGEA